MKTNPENYVPLKPSDFIGPAREIAIGLTKKAERLKQSPGNARLLIYGPPGVGKTRLAEMFARLLCPQASMIEDIHGRNIDAETVRRWHVKTIYVPLPGYWDVTVINECDTIPTVAQDLMLDYLDRIGTRPGMAVVGTSNLNLNQLTERFQSRFQPMKVKAPDTETIASLLSRWKPRANVANEIAVGCGGNVRAALLDLQTIADMTA